ncbi:MAG: Nucleic acid-binding protein [bacterium]|nr:MAG: Nucleic acid-binding protein [bacterium]
MVMQKVVLDTDIVIDFTRGASDLIDLLLNQVSEHKLKLFIPSSVVSELIAGQETKSVEELAKLERLISRFEFVAADYRIAKMTGILLRDYKALKLADATIAATALSLNAKLATRNKKDFEGVKELKFFKLR